MDANIESLLARRRMPALWFHTVEQPHSKSRLGGLPSLPDGVEWPVNPGTNLPLHFMAQIDLSSVPETPLPGCPLKSSLPRQGMLFFFFDYAEYWNDDLSAADITGVPNQSRVIHTLAAGEDRAAPATLPWIHYNPETQECSSLTKRKLLPQQHLRAYVIDTFWEGMNDYDDQGRRFPPLGDAAIEAKFQSIVRATGEAAPIYPSWETVPYPTPSYFQYIQEPPAYFKSTGDGVVHSVSKGWQMFGAAYWDGGSRPDQSRGALLAEFPLDDICGSLQFWIGTKDLKAQRFNRVFGVELNT